MTQHQKKMKIPELIKALRPLFNTDHSLDPSFSLGKDNDYVVRGNTVVLTLKRFNKNDEQALARAQKSFNNIVKELSPTLLELPDTDQLSFEDAVRWLYKHYPYSADNVSNCVLVAENNEIIAISDN
jgi:hypothetical protein